MTPEVNEKDLEPQKNQAISFCLIVLSIALITCAFFTFANDFTLKIVSLLLGAICFLFGLRAFLRNRRK